jgi:hypothetical protein
MFSNLNDVVFLSYQQSDLVEIRWNWRRKLLILTYEVSRSYFEGIIDMP